MTLTLDGCTYPLDTFADTDVLGQMVVTSTWAKQIPNCPTCHWPLTSDDHAREPRLDVYSGGAVMVVVCNECGWEKEVK